MDEKAADHPAAADKFESLSLNIAGVVILYNAIFQIMLIFKKLRMDCRKCFLKIV